MKAQLAAFTRTTPSSVDCRGLDDLEARRHALADKLAAEEAQLLASLQAPAATGLTDRRQNMLDQARQRAVAREELRTQVCDEVVSAEPGRCQTSRLA